MSDAVSKKHRTSGEVLSAIGSGKSHETLREDSMLRSVETMLFMEITPSCADFFVCVPVEDWAQRQRAAQALVKHLFQERAVLWVSLRFTSVRNRNYLRGGVPLQAHTTLEGHQRPRLAQGLTGGHEGMWATTCVNQNQYKIEGCKQELRITW